MLVAVPVYIGILVAFPVAVCTTLFCSQLYQFVRQHAKAVPEQSWRREPSKLFSLIWFLHALVAVVSFGLSVLDVRLLAHVAATDASEVVKTRLASNIALVAYFVAGLLPDPDEPFQPGYPHIHSWLAASLFQLALLLLSPEIQKIDNPHLFDGIVFAGEALRFGVIVINVSLLTYTHLIHLRPIDEDRGVYERLNAGEANGSASYSAIPTQPNAGSGPSRSDAQSTGWFNYFIGFRALFPYFWPSDSSGQQLMTLFCFVLLIAQRAINILVPYQIGVVISGLVLGTVPYKDLALYCIYRAMQGQQGIIGSARAIIWIPISQSLFRRLTYAVYEHVMMLSLDFHLSKKVGEVITALSKGSALNTFLDAFAFQLFPMIFDLGVAAVWLFIDYNAFYSVIVVGVLWAYVFATIYVAKYRGRIRRKMATREREMEATKMDAIMAYETVHHNNALPVELERFSDRVFSFQRAEFGVLFSLNALNALQNLIFILGVVLVSVLCAYEISEGTATVADFVTLITYFAQLQAPLAFFGSFYNQVQNNLVDAERMLDLFNKVPIVQDSPKAKPLLPRSDGKLEFKDVSFSYDPRKPVLKGISFAVEPGTTTALVGESGSGKSTCFKLIFRFFDVQAGSVEFDGRDLRDVTMQSLRQKIGVVPQDTVLFNDTLWYNIKYANPAATDQQVYDACQAASIHDRIMTFPDRYNTSVGERGLKLSGGEKQRIAIARAILKNPQLMLLDEATASLDSHTERLIQAALTRVTKDRTTITIAHRLSTITHADQILVMHDGEIIERGTHDYLLGLKGKYAAMWEKQTKAEEAKERVEAENAE